MRIVAGSRRGLALAAPDGRTTRPTADRAREALFNILSGPRYADRLRDRPAADFYAGTGAIGLEALSRGASHCTFLETDPAAFTVLNRNIAKARFDGAATVIRQDATHPPAARQACGLLFLDPPYADDVEPALMAAVRAGWLAGDGLAVAQLHPKTTFDAPAGLTVADDRRYGAARFVLLEPTP